MGEVFGDSPVSPQKARDIMFSGLLLVNSSHSLHDNPLANGDEELSMSVAEAITFSMLMSLCICMTVVGNVLVVLSVFTYRPLRSVQNFFIVSLAVADLAVAILVMPFNVANFVIGHWVFGPVFCNMWLTFDILTCTASILNLCAIALDRYYAIHDPIRYAQKRTLKRVLVTIAIVWLLSGLISIPPLIGWNNSDGSSLYNEDTHICELTNEKGFVLYSASGSFYIPLVIMTFVYVNIFRATRKRLRARARNAAAGKMKSRTIAASTKTTTAPKFEMKQESPSSESDTPSVHSLMPPPAAPKSVTVRASNGGQSVHTMLDASQQTDPATNSSNPIANPVAQNLLKPPTLKSPRKNQQSSSGDSPTKSPVYQFMEEKQRISLSRERRAARTMAIIMGVFVLCWLPFFLMYVIFPFCKSCTDDTDHRLINFIVWLGYINSTLNPIIYTVFNIDFRNAFKILLQGKCRA